MSSETPKGVIRFDGYRLTDFDYVCSSGFEFPADQERNYNMRIQKKTERLTDQTMQVELKVSVFWSDNDDYDNAPFKVFASLVGRFTSDSQIDLKWETNAIAILFPYVRSIITSFTSQTGREPVILPTINVAALLKSEAAKQESEKE